jgi:hypothetical protein
MADISARGGTMNDTVYQVILENPDNCANVEDRGIGIHQPEKEFIAAYKANPNRIYDATENEKGSLYRWFGLDGLYCLAPECWLIFQTPLLPKEEDEVPF